MIWRGNVHQSVQSLSVYPDKGPAILQGEHVFEVAEFLGPSCLEAEMVEVNRGTFCESHQTYWILSSVRWSGGHVRLLAGGTSRPYAAIEHSRTAYHR